MKSTFTGKILVYLKRTTKIQSARYVYMCILTTHIIYFADIRLREARNGYWYTVQCENTILQLFAILAIFANTRAAEFA